MSLEKDIAGLKKVMEADVFKPASQKELDKRAVDRKKRIAADKAARKEVCPECGEILRDVGVYSIENVHDTVQRNYDWNDDKKEWEETDVSRDESSYDDTEEWHCTDCDAILEEGTDFVLNEADVFAAASKDEIYRRQEMALPLYNIFRRGDQEARGRERGRNARMAIIRYARQAGTSPSDYTARKVNEADIFKPASQKELQRRLDARKRFRFVYSYIIDVMGADEQDARYEFENIDLEPKDERVIDAQFIDLEDVYEVDSQGHEIKEEKK